MRRLGRRRSRSYRVVGLRALGALGIAVACGGNPELSLTGDSFEGGAELGEDCETSQDCATDLLCGPEGQCVRGCGDLTGNGCGDEACLPDGSCSEGLGEACKNDDSCNAGLVCSSVKRCSVPCEPDAEDVCKGSQACRDDGTCPTDDDVVLGFGGAGGDEPPDGAGGSGNCIDVEVTFEPQIPTVLLLIDRSASMNANNFGDAVAAAVTDGSYTLGDCPDNNDWRWNVVRDVLFNPDKGIVKPLEDRVRFGLSLYSSSNGQLNLSTEDDFEDIDPTKMCPVLIEVPLALGNHQAMLDQFQCSDLLDDTPTGESLLAAATTLQAFDEPGPKVIVLATDGQPDNCACPDFGDEDPAMCRVAGLPTQIQADVVDTAEQIYPGFSPGALSTAFEDIINGARSCIIDLDGEIADGKEATGTVTLDGEELELDGDDGWQVNTPSQIELLGTACEAIKSGDHDLEINFPCEAFDPVVH